MFLPLKPQVKILPIAIQLKLLLVCMLSKFQSYTYKCMMLTWDVASICRLANPGLVESCANMLLPSRCMQMKN